MNSVNRRLLHAHAEPLTIERVWTLCELIVYRLRDERQPAAGPAREAYTEVAVGIRELRLAWQRSANAIPPAPANPYVGHHGRAFRDLADDELCSAWRYWNWEIENAPGWSAALGAAKEFRRAAMSQLHLRGIQL